MILIQVDIVGGSISGLSTAISLKQHNKSIDVIVHEKYKKIEDSNLSCIEINLSEFYQNEVSINELKEAIITSTKYKEWIYNNTLDDKIIKFKE